MMKSRRLRRRQALRFLLASTAAAALTAAAWFGVPIVVRIMDAPPEAVASTPPVDAVPAKPSVDPVATAGLPARIPDRAAAPPGDIEKLRGGLDALTTGDVAGARAARDALPRASVDRHLLSWVIAMDGGPDILSGEIAATAGELVSWPGASALRANSERAIARENPPPETVIAAFGASAPQTIQGAILLARAQVALGGAATAQATLGPFWHREQLDASDEATILAEFGAVLTEADHRQRMERMLHSERFASAEGVAGLARAQDLAKAWTAVLRKDRAAADLLEAVPAAQRSAGWHFARAKYLRWQGRYKAAAEAVFAAPREPDELADRDAWWVERRVLSRELIDIDEPGLAYRIAAEHAAESPADQADAEFHAGWYALRFLSEPEKAAAHFRRIAVVASGPISLSRAHYWLGRAIEAGAQGDAKGEFVRAAHFGTTFYGQLAAARLGRSAIAIDAPVPTEADRAAFAGREPVAAIERLELAGHPALANRLYRELARQISAPGEIALLAAKAEARGDHHMALRIGKIAAAEGVDVGALSHPTGAIPDDAAIAGAGKALTYAIARQESEFNASARSGAGALGLLQLLPGTAKDMAKKSGLEFSQPRLTSDPAYNAALGAAYLGEQIDRFDGSYVLTFAGYNAGPRRAREWVERYGDPRGKDIDAVVDWIERIPFTETRNYVLRVMENYQVYKMRLAGSADIEKDLVEGR